LFLHSLPSATDPSFHPCSRDLPRRPTSPRSVMKFVFEIKTEPTLRALVAIFVVAFCSASLASISVYLSDPLTGKFCALVLATIVFLALRY